MSPKIVALCAFVMVSSQAPCVSMSSTATLRPSSERPDSTTSLESSLVGEDEGSTPEPDPLRAPENASKSHLFPLKKGSKSTFSQWFRPKNVSEDRRRGPNLGPSTCPCPAARQIHFARHPSWSPRGVSSTRSWHLPRGCDSCHPGAPERPHVSARFEQKARTICMKLGLFPRSRPSQVVSSPFDPPPPSARSQAHLKRRRQSTAAALFACPVAYPPVCISQSVQSGCLRLRKSPH